VVAVLRVLVRRRSKAAAPTAPAEAAAAAHAVRVAAGWRPATAARVHAVGVVRPHASLAQRLLLVRQRRLRVWRRAPDAPAAAVEVVGVRQPARFAAAAAAPDCIANRAAPVLRVSAPLAAR
jgi:hypothetical protein